MCMRCNTTTTSGNQFLQWLCSRCKEVKEGGGRQEEAEEGGSRLRQHEGGSSSLRIFVSLLQPCCCCCCCCCRRSCCCCCRRQRQHAKCKASIRYECECECERVFPVSLSADCGVWSGSEIMEALRICARFQKQLLFELLLLMLPQTKRGKPHWREALGRGTVTRFGGLSLATF